MAKSRKWDSLDRRPSRKPRPTMGDEGSYEPASASPAVPTSPAESLAIRALDQTIEQDADDTGDQTSDTLDDVVEDGRLTFSA